MPIDISNDEVEILARARELTDKFCVEVYARSTLLDKIPIKTQLIKPGGEEYIRVTSPLPLNEPTQYALEWYEVRINEWYSYLKKQRVSD